MAYRHIPALYKVYEKEIAIFSWVWWTEKVHGTGAHLLKNEHGLYFHCRGSGVGGDRFRALFDVDQLAENLASIPRVKIHGEAYGGRVQGMGHVYGPHLRFVAFDVQIGDSWLSVPDAAAFADQVGLDFVPWGKTDTRPESLDALRDAPSIVADRLGFPDKEREGIVIRPPFEVVKNNGQRVVAKHRIYSMSERKSPPELTEGKRAALSEAEAIADEWVTPLRLVHVLDALRERGVEVSSVTQTRDVIDAMIEDVEREAAGEIVVSRAARRAIGRTTEKLLSQHLNKTDAIRCS